MTQLTKIGQSNKSLFGHFKTGIRDDMKVLCLQIIFVMVNTDS